VSTTWSASGTVGPHLRWWLTGLGWLLREAPGHLLVVLAVVWWTRPISLWLLAGLLAVVQAGRVLLARHPRLWRLAGPLLGVGWLYGLRRKWLRLCDGCGLARQDPELIVRTGVLAHRRARRAARVRRREVPRIRRTRVEWPHTHVIVRPVLGQSLDDFADAADGMRLGAGATRLRVEPSGRRDVRLTFTVGDQLRLPFPAVVPDQVDDLDSVVLGRREDGQPWRLAVGPHTLVAGCSGAGKGSVFWCYAFALAPASAAGRVQLHGIDLKGGMEIRMGDPLFTTVATNAAEAVGVLELLVSWMRERAARYAGQTRAHVASVAEPLQVVMIDELAALTAYAGDRELQRRAETAINLLCSQGRAPGFVVLACLQDPRKEVIPSRGLFTQMVGLRLKDLAETAMVLGETAVATGAFCHRITRDVPGTGFVLPEDGTPPIRVRAGYATDTMIKETAGRFPAVLRIPVEPAVADELRSRRPRTPGVA
jgi:S-DNA-T family DNA segregation ATPase FtsK/SpoIIIE